MATRFSLVIPTYNETANIAGLCRKIVEVLSSQPLAFEVIIVDDNSPDGTWKIAEDLASSDARIKVIRRLNDRGLATAVTAGWAKAEGDIIGVIDGDLQHPPDILKLMLTDIMCDNEVDIVVASRYISGGGVFKWGIWRRIISRFATFLSGFFIPKVFRRVKDPMSGYFILRKSVISGRNLTPIGYKILLEVLVKGNYRKVLEVPYVFQKREAGGSKAGIGQYFISLFHFVKLRFYRGR
jgi:dolichol-phosphate mannosyltransferase